MSGAEIMILLIVGIVVVGPKRLPGMMRTAGQWVAKVRRMTSNVRENTGIDRIIREEGLEKEIRELQSLARSPVIQSLLKASPAGMVTQALSNAAAAASLGNPLAAASPATAPAKPATKLASPGSSASALEKNGDAAAPVLPPDPARASSAASLLRPAEGTVARGADQALAVLTANGFFSFREREYPTIGCDSYDAMPDDLDDPDAYPDEPPEVFGPPEPEAEPAAEAAASASDATPAANEASTDGGSAVVGTEASPSEEPVTAAEQPATPASAESAAEPSNGEKIEASP